MSGSGKRFKDAGYTVPKPLIVVDGRPMIHHVVDLFPGVQNVTFICNKDDIQNTNMRAILVSACPWANIIVIDSHKKGPVYAIAQIFDSIADEEEVIVSYCDYGTRWDFDQFLIEARNGQFDGALACYRGFHPHMLGSDNYAFCREDGRVLLEIKEKESFTSNKMSEFASNGTYYFRTGAILKKYFRELMDRDININGEYYVSLVYNLLIRDGLKSLIFEIENMLQWGTPYDLEIYQGWSRYFAALNKPVASVPSQDFVLVLPMAGRGERFVKEGYAQPKPLIPIDGMPMFVRAVSCLPKHEDAIFIGLRNHAGIDRIIHKHYPNASVSLIDAVTEGQACTCEIGIREAGIDADTPILISACDNGALYDRQKFIELMDDQDNDVIVWSFRNSQASKTNPSMYSWLDVDDNGFVRHVFCKQLPWGDPLKTHAIIGTMYFRKARHFLDGLHANRRQNRRANGEFYVDDVLNQNIESGLKVKIFEVDHYVCWGTPNDYKTYNYWNDYFNVHNSKR